MTFSKLPRGTLDRARAFVYDMLKGHLVGYYSMPVMHPIMSFLVMPKTLPTGPDAPPRQIELKYVGRLEYIQEDFMKMLETCSLDPDPIKVRLRLDKLT